MNSIKVPKYAIKYTYSTIKRCVPKIFCSQKSAWIGRQKPAKNPAEAKI
jgi:hypothetical protein